MSKVQPLEFTTEDFYKCTALNIRSLIYVVCFFLLLSCISALINSFFMDRDTMDDILLEEIMKRRRSRRTFNQRFMRDNLLGRGIVVEEYPTLLEKGLPKMSSLETFTNETFSNDDFYSYVDVLKPNYSNYQYTRLTPPNDIFGNPENYQIGEAYKLLKPLDEKRMELFLDVSAGLYLLNANPFGKDNVSDNKVVDQDYLIYLLNTKTKDKKLLSKLAKDGDNVYKYTYKTTNPKEIEELMAFDMVNIVYKKDSKEMVVLQGNFMRNI